MNDNAIEVMRSRLCQHRGRYREISSRHGIPYSTLSQFARGTRGKKRPSYAFIEKLQSVLDEIEGSRPASVDG